MRRQSVPYPREMLPKRFRGQSPSRQDQSFNGHLDYNTGHFSSTELCNHGPRFHFSGNMFKLKNEELPFCCSDLSLLWGKFPSEEVIASIIIVITVK